MSGLGATKPSRGLASLDLGSTQLRSRLGAKLWQHYLDLPEIKQHIDVFVARLRDLEDTTTADPDKRAITDAVIEETEDADNANNSDNDREDDGSDHSREEMFTDSTLYPFLNIYDRYRIRDAHTLA